MLIVLNIYVTFFLIKATARFTHSPLLSARLIVSSVIGSLFSLVMLLPGINFLLLFTVKVLAAFIIVLIAFEKRRPKEYVKLCIYFYIMNFVFSGVIMGFKYLFRPDYIAVKNTFVYIDTSLMSFVIFTAAAYFIICVARLWLDNGSSADGNYSVIIKNKEKIISLDALADTGNSMTDVFSGKPVIICPGHILQQIIGEEPSCEEVYDKMASSSVIKGIRLVPYSTIDKTGMIPAFIPDEIIIRKNDNYHKVDALIGINQGKNMAIFNPKLLY